MTLEKEHELITMRDHGQEAVDTLIQKHGLEPQCGILSGMKLENAFKS